MHSPAVSVIGFATIMLTLTAPLFAAPIPRPSTISVEVGANGKAVDLVAELVADIAVEVPALSEFKVN